MKICIHIQGGPNFRDGNSGNDTTGKNNGGFPYKLIFGKVLFPKYRALSFGKKILFVLYL